MARHRDYVLVLWADQFEEAPATIFVTELREAGLRVKVVGLTPSPIAGSHGLALVPDLTLDQALTLATRTICLVIPQSIPGLKSLGHEPRLHQLFDLAGKYGARFVMGPTDRMDVSELRLFQVAAISRILVYPQGEEMMEFVCGLARLLLED